MNNSNFFVPEEWESEFKKLEKKLIGINVWKKFFLIDFDFGKLFNSSLERPLFFSTLAPMTKRKKIVHTVTLKKLKKNSFIETIPRKKEKRAAKKKAFSA